MKTTVSIPAPLLKKAKKYAENHNMTLKTLITLGLDAKFHQSGATQFQMKGAT
jgi:hypothetical protein